jgi:DNA helicase-2/ATP-dependent DNA helicase PcrA
MHLNPSQQAVVKARQKRTLVVAGAGTGKTAASTHWVADLVAEGVNPANILMLTFTRKAGEEMKKRASALIRELPGNRSAKGLIVGNYHSVSLQQLRADPIGFRLSTDKFTILAQDDEEKLWKEALKAVGIEKPTGPLIPSRLVSTVSRIVNRCQDPVKRLPKCFKSHSQGAAAVQAYQNVVSMKQATNCLGFDDILVCWCRRLREGVDPVWKKMIRDKWQYVLVDEFQDNNPLNAEIIRRLDPHCLLVVGDGNQTIYGFRNADPSLMEKFRIEQPDTVLLKLEDNYRSGQRILDLANQIVAKSVMPLVLRSGRGTEGAVEYRVYPDQRAETDAAVAWVQGLIQKGVKPNEICILSRSSFAFLGIELELKHHNLLYKKYGGLTLADAAEVKDFVSFLRVLHNPKDKSAWLRALVQFPRMGEAGAMNFLKPYPDGAIPAAAWPPATHKMRTWLDELLTLPTLKGKLSYLANQMELLIEHNYRDDYEKRMTKLRAIVQAEQDDNRPLPAFLDSFATEQFANHQHPETHLTISTIHSAKGLEWEYVWLVGVGDLQMPHKRSESDEEKREELRLAYVAVTRARDHLVCSYGQTFGGGMDQNPCPYFPPGLVWERYDEAGRKLPPRPGATLR